MPGGRKKYVIFAKTMFMRNIILISGFIILISTRFYGQADTSFCISPAESNLFESINAYRKIMGKYPLGLSKNLSIVARAHLTDILEHHPDTGICSPYSWSFGNQGDTCCIARGKNSLDCSRSKPLYLTTYPDVGYELLYYDDHAADPESALRFWKTEKISKDMLLGEGRYSELQWVAIGIAVDKNYISLWLGEAPDSETETPVCHSGKKIPFVLPEKMKGKVFLSRADHKFHIVLASSDSNEGIKKKFMELHKSNLNNLRIISADKRFRIITGSFADRKAANKALKKYRKYVKDAWIIQY